MPRKPLNLQGQRFGSLTAVRMLDGGGAGIHKRWECLCDCGRVIVVQSSALSREQTTRCTTCSCSTIKVGDLWGKWSILGHSRTIYTGKGNHFTYWLCQCSCGKTKEVVANNLLQGKSTQCKSCSLTKHGQSRTREYKNHKWREYYENKRVLDAEWSLEMTTALRAYFNQCVVCGMSSEEHQIRYGQMLHIDHVKPLSKDYGLEIGNAIILCHSCNTRKNKKMPDNLPDDVRDKVLSAAEEFKLAWESGFRAK